MRWSRRALLPAIVHSLILCLPASLPASDLSVGALHLVAGGGLGDGADALTVALQPTSVLATDAGLFVADEQYNRVRQVRDDGTIASVAGTGVYGFNGSGLPALSSHLGIVADIERDAAGRLFLVDGANRQVRVLNPDGNLYSFVTSQHPLFASYDASFAPASVSLRADGGVLVADRGTNVVWHFDADGRGRRAAGNGTRGFAGDGAPSALGQLADPRAVAAGHDGAIWIADTGNRRLRVVSPSGNLLTAAGNGSGDALVVAGAGALQTGIKPIDVAVSDDGRQVFLLDDLGRQVLRLGSSVRFVDGDLHGADDLTVVHRFAADSRPTGIDIGHDGRLYVADAGRRQAFVLDLTTSDAVPRAVAGNGTQRAAGDGTDARNASLFAPAGLSLAPDGSLYLADSRNDLVRVVGADGVIRSTALLAPGDPPLSRPSDVVFDRAGRAHIADAANGRVLRAEEDGGVTLLVQGLRDPAALAFDAEGHLLIAEADARLVRRLEADGSLTTIAGTGDTLYVDDGGPATAVSLVRPVDLAVDRRGGLWIADAGSHRVLRLGADGLLRVVAGTGVGGRGLPGTLARDAALQAPSGVAPDGAGGAFVADAGNGRLVHVDADGVLRAVAEEGQPARVTTTPAGDVLFTDVQSHRVWQVRVVRRVAPVAQRVRLDDDGWSVRTQAALTLPGVRQILRHPVDGTPLVSGTSTVRPVDAGQAALLRSEADRFVGASLQIDGFGPSLLIGARSSEGQPKPLTLVRFVDGRSERFDLEFLFAGAEALVVGASGDIYVHEPGRLLRLPRERLLNIPGFPGAVGGRGIEPGAIEPFADLPAESAVLTPAPQGGVYVALQGSREILLVRDLDGDGRARGPLEQRRLGRLEATPVALAASGADLFAGTDDNRVVRLDAGRFVPIASGFAPLLLDLAVDPTGGLLLLEGDAAGGRLLRLAPAQPSLAGWPAIVDYGAAPLGQGVSSTVVLRNDGTIAVDVRPETASGDPLEAGLSLRLGPGEVREVETRWRPPAPGEAHDELLWRDAGGRVLLRQSVTIHGLAPRLEVTESVDLGTAWVGGAEGAALDLVNAGDADLRVTDLELLDVEGRVLGRGATVSDGAFRVALSSATVAPGESMPVSLAFRPARPGDHEAILRLHSDDPLRPAYDVALRGAGGRAAIALDPVDLGTLQVGRLNERSLVLRNTGDLDLRIDRILTGTRELILTPRSLVVPAGAARSVRVDARPASHGDLRGRFVLWTNDPAQPRKEIPFHGLGASGLVNLSSSAHDFGAVGSSIRWSVEVHNLRDRPLRLLDVSTDNAAFRVVARPRVIEAGERASVVVEFTPASPVPTRGQLLLRTDLVAAPEIAVALRGRGRVATRLRLAEPSAPSLWPGESLALPLEVDGARDLRGLLFTLELPEGWALQRVEVPPTSLLGAAGQVLTVVEETADGPRVGLSLTGGAAAVSGSGLAALVHLTPSGEALTSLSRLRLGEVLARSDGELQDHIEGEGPPRTTPRWRGDVNGDGRLDGTDLANLLAAVEAGVTGGDFDVDGDGRIDAADVELLRQHLPAGKPTGEALPTVVGLDEAYPNPFNAETVIGLQLPVAARVEVVVYNLLGQPVRRLQSGTVGPGHHRLVWDGRDDAGRSLTSGAYFVVLEAAAERAVRRLTLLR
jgi:DNA-binding beta-propeller fold protein YncE